MRRMSIGDCNDAGRPSDIFPRQRLRCTLIPGPNYKERQKGKSVEYHGDNPSRLRQPPYPDQTSWQPLAAGIYFRPGFIKNLPFVFQASRLVLASFHLYPQETSSGWNADSTYILNTYFTMSLKNEFSLKAELETWAAALKAYDDEDFEKSLDLFSVSMLSYLSRALS
jgi:hypothetical protein